MLILIFFFTKKEVLLLFAHLPHMKQIGAVVNLNSYFPPLFV